MCRNKNVLYVSNLLVSVSTFGITKNRWYRIGVVSIWKSWCRPSLPQASCKLFQRLAASLQISRCIKSDFRRCNFMKPTGLMQFDDKFASNHDKTRNWHFITIFFSFLDKEHAEWSSKICCLSWNKRKNCAIRNFCIKLSWNDRLSHDNSFIFYTIPVRYEVK